MEHHDQQQWVESILNSLNNRQETTPSEQLYAHICRRIQQQTQVIPLVWVRIAACVAGLLLLLNALLLSKGSSSVGTSIVTTELQSLNTNFNLYDE